MNTRIEYTIKKLPDVPGVYFFYNEKKECIYVGKATSLKNRVRSYWSGKKTFRPIEEMIHEVVDIQYKETETAIEAAMLEGAYIKQLRPTYNVLWKDDKSWNYIVMTKDSYPEVTTVREHDLKGMTDDEIKKTYAYVFGPYPGLHVRPTMKLLYKLFQISSCRPDAKRPCLYYQMEQCLGVCAGDITAREYKKKVIRPLVLFLRGGKKRVITMLEKRMKEAAKEHDFEEAARLRNQIFRLQHIHDMAMINSSFVEDTIPESVKRKSRGRGVGAEELENRKSGEGASELVETPQASSLRATSISPMRGDEALDTYYLVDRIEGYDISNLGPTGIVGSMVVFDMHGPVKSEYRKFKVRGLDGQSDVDALEEVLRRRLAHDEWPLPQIFLIDGGKPQVHKTIHVLQDIGIQIPVVGIAKGSKRKKNEFMFGKMEEEEWVTIQRQVIRWVHEHKKLLIQVRDEAHRFAVKYQRQTRKLR